MTHPWWLDETPVDDDWDWDTEIGALEPVADPADAEIAARRRAAGRCEPWDGSGRESPRLQLCVLTPQAVGEFLRAARAHAGLSQRALAAAAGVPRSTLSGLEAGRAEDVRLSTLTRLTTACGVDLVGRCAEPATTGAALAEAASTEPSATESEFADPTAAEGTAVESPSTEAASTQAASTQAASTKAASTAAGSAEASSDVAPSDDAASAEPASTAVASSEPAATGVTLLHTDLSQRHRDVLGRMLPAHLLNFPVHDAAGHGGWWGFDRPTLLRERAMPTRTYGTKVWSPEFLAAVAHGSGEMERRAAFGRPGTPVRPG